MLQRCISSSALCIKLNIFYPQICAFVQEDKDPASLLSAATTVLLRSPLRNEIGGQIMFRYTLSIQWIQKQCKWHWQSCMSFQALSTMALVRSKSGDWGRSWCSRASGDILKLLFIFLASFQELSTMALDLVGSKSNWWLESQLEQQSFRWHLLSKLLWCYAGADPGAYMYLSIYPPFILLITITILYRRLAISFDGGCGGSRFFKASGDCFCQYAHAHVFVVEIPILQRFVSSSALCIK